jgi:hypothetical protein
MPFLDAVRSEWTKIRTLPATRGVLLAAAVLTLALGMLHRSHVICGYLLVQLLLGVLGVLSVTSEYATGMIRTSLAAVPKRGRLLGAKAVVCSAAAFAIGAVAGPGAGLYLALIGLAGVAAGFLVRTAAAAHVLLLVTAFTEPVLAPLLPAPLDRLAQRYWPTAAGAQFLGGRRDPHALPAWAALGLLAAVVAVTLAGATVAFRCREY